MPNKINVFIVFLLTFIAGTSLGFLGLEVNAHTSQKSNQSSFSELEEFLPTETKCAGKIVENFSPLQDATAGDPAININPKNSLVKQVDVIKCVQHDGKGILIEKAIFKDGFYLVINQPQNVAYYGGDYIFVLPRFYHNSDDIKFWYKKTSELISKIDKTKLNTPIQYDSIEKILYDAYANGYINENNQKIKLHYGLTIYHPYGEASSGEGENEIITLNKPIKLKNNKGYFIKLSYWIGPI